MRYRWLRVPYSSLSPPSCFRPLTIIRVTSFDDTSLSELPSFADPGFHQVDLANELMHGFGSEIARVPQPHYFLPLGSQASHEQVPLGHVEAPTAFALLEVFKAETGP